MTTGKLSRASILVVGDIILDEYVWGDVTRVSPEAPVPIVEISHRSVVPGGAGNTAAAVTALGGRVALAGVVGDDPGAGLLRDTLVSSGVGIDGVLTDMGRQTTTKSRLLARGQHVVRMDAEDRTPIPTVLVAELTRYARAQAQLADAVVLSDYAKGTLCRELTSAVIDVALHRGTPVVADPAGEDYSVYCGATMVTPSVAEVERAVGRPVRADSDLLDAGHEVARLLPGTSVLITRGAQGMWLMSESKVELDLPARARSVYDITGAGDTVAATLAVALARGVPMPAAVALANAAAGVVVSKVGTASVTLDELAGELSELPPTGSPLWEVYHEASEEAFRWLRELNGPRSPRSTTSRRS